jgi:hypothetical protein
MAEYEDITKQITKYISDKEKLLSGNVNQLQKELFAKFMSDFVGKLETKQGIIIQSPKNLRLLYDIDKIFLQFNNQFQKSVLKDFGSDLLKLVDFNNDYYSTQGINKKILNNVTDKTRWVAESIGIDSKGNIKTGSYLDSLSKNDAVKTEIKNYTLNSINSKTDLNTFISGMKDQIVGNKDIPGRLQKYYKQYAFDTFSQTERAISNFYADNLNLNFFIYTGGVISDTRPFCRSRNGNVYSRKEAEKWNKIKPWTGAKLPLNFFSDMGGYNCRHQLRWISDELAYSLRPELKKAA